jgi:hypothetical protein
MCRRVFIVYGYVVSHEGYWDHGVCHAPFIGLVFVKFHIFLFLIKIYIELFTKIGTLNCFSYWCFVLRYTIALHNLLQMCMLLKRSC